MDAMPMNAGPPSVVAVIRSRVSAPRVNGASSAQQRVEVGDHDRVAGGAHRLERRAERALGIAMVLGRPQCTTGEQHRQSDGQQQHSRDGAHDPHQRLPL